jgi:predicted Rossmann-fold nucleotide-binding protein
MDRMVGPVTPDGKLGAHPEGGGQAALFFEEADLQQRGVDRIIDKDPDLVLLGRSVLGQIGVDVVLSGEAVRSTDDNQVGVPGIWIPINMETHAKVGEALVSDVRTILDKTRPGTLLKWQEKTLPFGRYADMGSLEKLNADEVQRDIDNSVISLDPKCSANNPKSESYRINDDGSLSIKLSPLEFKLNEAHLHETPAIPEYGIAAAPASPDVRLELLHRGRPGIRRNSWIEQKDPNERLPNFLLGGILLSPGGRYWNIRPEVAPNVYQIPSAAHFDGNRIDGIGDHLDPYFRHRQVELVVDGPNRPTFDETYVTLDLFRSRELSGDTPINWLSLSLEARRSRHLLGVTALQALETADETNRNALFGVVDKTNIAALVLHRNGIGVVPETGNHSANRRLIKNALRSTPNGIPNGLEHLRGLVERLQNAGDRTSTVVAQELKLEHLPDLVDDGGASAFLAKKYSGENIAVNHDELTLLTGLSRQNVGLAQAENGDYREFHPMGLWVKPGVSEMLRLKRERVFIALFGAARPWVGKDLNGEIGELMDELIDVEGDPNNIAFVHGNGEGTMRSACENARQRGILSLGTGINAELNGQGVVNTDADGVINMQTWDWIVRQHQLDTHASVAYVVEGAHGTGAEIFNMITSRKLQIRMPAPMFIRNPNGEFEGIKEQIKLNTDQSQRKNSARRWVAETVHYVDSLPESIDTYSRFRSDMAAYWKKAGVPPEHIALAFERRRASLGRFGLQVPLSEQTAALSYAGDLISIGL